MRLFAPFDDVSKLELLFGDPLRGADPIREERRFPRSPRAGDFRPYLDGDPQRRLAGAGEMTGHTPRADHRRRRWTTMLTFLVIGVALCCGLCAYGINKAVRRTRERRLHDAHALTGR